MKRNITFLFLFLFVGCTSKSNPGSTNNTLTFPVAYTGMFYAHHLMGSTSCTMTLSRADDTIAGTLLLQYPQPQSLKRQGHLVAANIYAMDTVRVNNGAWEILSGGLLQFNSDRTSFTWTVDYGSTQLYAPDTIIAKR